MKSSSIGIPPALLPYHASGYSASGTSVPLHVIPEPWAAAGALHSSIADMTKYLLANLGLITQPADLIKALLSSQQGLFEIKPDVIQAMGWARNSSPDGSTTIVWKNGGVTGFNSYIGMVPPKKLGIVLLANKAPTKITANGAYILKKLAALA
jgi:CubicO group peptidase (beta-lactamase class C family)